MNDFLAQEIIRMKIRRITYIFYHFLIIHVRPPNEKTTVADGNSNFSCIYSLFFGHILVFQRGDAADALLFPGRCGLSLLGFVHPVILPWRQLCLLSGHDSRPHQRPPSGPAAQPHHPENVFLFLPAWTAANRCGTSCCTFIQYILS